MTSAHLTEKQLQLYADEPETTDAAIQDHIAHCQHCRTSLENYRLLNSAIRGMPSPAFNYDLAAVVVASAVRKKEPLSFPPVLAAVFGVSLVTVIISLYARNIYALFSALPATWGYVLTIPVLVVLVAQSIISVTGHQRRMNIMQGK